MSVNPSDKGLLTPENCTVIFVDHQPQMFFGINVQPAQARGIES